MIYYALAGAALGTAGLVRSDEILVIAPALLLAAWGYGMILALLNKDWP
mgnify:CR=1 FL=1